MSILPNWADGPLVAFDLETTGVDVESDRIVTASVVAIDGSTPRVRSWLANPGIVIPEGASAVHGITTEHAKAHGSPAQEVVIEVANALCDAWANLTPVVIFNAPYDLTLLDRELRRYGYDGLPAIGPVVDPLVLDRLADPYRKGSRKLVDVARHYGVTLTAEDAHTSAGDCLAAARVAWCIANRTKYGQLSLDDLQEQQRRGHAAWAANFQVYKRRQGSADMIDGSWPIRPFVAADGGMFPAPEVTPASAGLL